MSPHYGMFSDEGDEAIDEVVDYFKKELADLEKYTRVLFEEIRLDHAELTDTAVREEVYGKLHGLTQDFAIDAIDFYSGVVEGMRK